MSYVQPGERILVTGLFDNHFHRGSVFRAVVVERIPERDALGPNGAAFRYRYAGAAKHDEMNRHAMPESREGTHWTRGWTRVARDALLAARALANEPT